MGRDQDPVYQALCRMTFEERVRALVRVLIEWRRRGKERLSIQRKKKRRRRAKPNPE